jgi:hypothetical protein
MIRSFALLCFLVSADYSALQTAVQLETQVKAAFLVNFARYTEWPKRQPSAGSFQICIAGEGMSSTLEATVRGEGAGGRPIAVRSLSGGDDGRDCEVLFIAASEAKRRQTDLLNAVHRSPVLTVGESEDFIANGGIIRFLKAGNRIRFEINPDAAKRASLTISSRLLRLADLAKAPGNRQ